MAAAGLFGLNGAFVYGLLHPGTMGEAMANPVALAFLLEALVLLPVLAFLLHRWRVLRMHWAWFVALALLGSLAFALPVAVLWGRGGAIPRVAAEPSRDPGRSGRDS